MTKRNPCVFESMERRTLMSGGELPIGEVVGGEIASVGGQDRWTFDARAGDTIAWALTSTPTQVGFDATVQLLGPSGQQKTWRTAGRYDNVALDEDGVHTLVVRDYDDRQTGQYTLCVEPLNGVAADATPLAKGGIASGTVAARIERDQWTFEGSAGDIVTFALTGAPTQAGFDATANVYAPSGAQATWFTAGGRHMLTLAESGTYTVAVSDYDAAQTGAYTLGFEGINPISPDAIALGRGALASASIDAGNDVEQLSFTGKAGDRVALALSSTATVSGFDATVNLYAPSGTRVTWFTAGGQRFIDLLEDGTYLIDVQDYDCAQKGRFTIGLEGINPPSPQPIALAHGITQNGATEAGIDVDQFTFTARAGERVRLTLADAPIEAGYIAAATLFDGSGAQLHYAHADTSTFTAPRDGAYLVQVHDDGFARRGNYGLTLYRTGQDAPAPVAVQGRVFHDGNGDGRQGRGETGLKDWVVYLDMNRNGRRDAGERTARTDVDGAWAITGLRDGSYSVRPLVQPGYVPTPAGAGARVVEYRAGRQATVHFGVAKPARVGGQVFTDANGDGVRGRTERFAAGWTVFADLNGNGRRDRGERYSVSDRNGRWTINGLLPGSITMRTVRRRGYVVTASRGGALRLKLASASASLHNVFGVRPIAG